MTRLLSLVAVLAALPVAAQEADLGGWTLPEGAVVTSTSLVTMRGNVVGPGGEVTFQDQHSETLETTIDGVEGGRLVRAVQRVEASEAKTFIGGARTPVEPDPLLGRTVVTRRDGEGWQREPVGWRPSEAAQNALDEPVTLDDAEYPERPVAVGETVRVDAETIHRVYLNATPGDHALTVTLDSLGTFEGGPAAFLSQEVSVTVDLGEGTMEMDMTARIVRRLDWKIDVWTVWEGPVVIDFGEARIEGTMRFEGTQEVTLPSPGG